ncbi:MAG: HAMP domain-containing histidine kinase, partial [Proteobacteria bacterium]|nr:HAMP domain-containing histidine kinase [Pseudomonadota bacterium]
DFNNVLGIIMGNTELALVDCKDLQIRKILDLILEQTLRGRNLTKNLVAFAKDQEPKQEFFRINEKINLVLTLLKKDLEGIELIQEDKPGIPPLLADPGMIEHALVNLIQNSMHAVSLTKYPKIILRTHCLDNKILFEIEDNGCGILEEHLEKIYEPSFTLKGTKDVKGLYENSIKGTGYGMANVKKYIELHKGNILIASTFGSGTTVTISLPVIHKELTPKEKTQIQQTTIHVGKYILLVEDVYDHVRKTDKDIPILFISGNIDFLESIKELKQKDARIDHLPKPCRNKEYVYSINRLIGNQLTGMDTKDTAGSIHA